MFTFSCDSVMCCWSKKWEVWINHRFVEAGVFDPVRRSMSSFWDFWYLSILANVLWLFMYLLMYLSLFIVIVDIWPSSIFHLWFSHIFIDILALSSYWVYLDFQNLIACLVTSWNEQNFFGMYRDTLNQLTLFEGGGKSGRARDRTEMRTRKGYIPKDKGKRSGHEFEF